MAELADVRDLKSRVRKDVRVRPPPWGYQKKGDNRGAFVKGKDWVLDFPTFGSLDRWLRFLESKKNE